MEGRGLGRAGQGRGGAQERGSASRARVGTRGGAQSRVPTGSLPTGTLSFFNQVRMWSYTTPLTERRVSYFRWAVRHQLPRQPNSDQTPSAESSFVNDHGASSRGDSAIFQNTEESPQPDSSTSVPVTPPPSDLP